MFSIEALAERNAARMLTPKYFIFTTLDLLRPRKVVTCHFQTGFFFRGEISRAYRHSPCYLEFIQIYTHDYSYIKKNVNTVYGSKYIYSLQHRNANKQISTAASGVPLGLSTGVPTTPSDHATGFFSQFVRVQLVRVELQQLQCIVFF